MVKYRIRRLIFFSLVIAAIVGVVAVVPNLNNLQKFIFISGIRTLDGRASESVDDVIPQGTTVVIMVYFTTNCPSCLEQLEMLREYHEMPARVIAINVGESENAVRNFVEKHNFPYIFLIGAAQPPGQGVPHTIIIVRSETGWQKITEWLGAREPMEAFEE